MNFEVLENFNVEIIKKENSFDKIRVESSKLCELLYFLKNNAEFDFDRLNTIIAVDLYQVAIDSSPHPNHPPSFFDTQSKKAESFPQGREGIARKFKLSLDYNFELIYDLHSVKTAQQAQISVLLDRNSPKAPSITEIFKSAYFDECEIFDLFGIEFTNNPNLKRLFMPKGWVGYPLRKDYKQTDERLAWNGK